MVWPFIFPRCKWGYCLTPALFSHQLSNPILINPLVIWWPLVIWVSMLGPKTLKHWSLKQDLLNPDQRLAKPASWRWTWLTPGSPMAHLTSVCQHHFTRNREKSLMRLEWCKTICFVAEMANRHLTKQNCISRDDYPFHGLHIQARTEGRDFWNVISVSAVLRNVHTKMPFTDRH